MNSLIKEVQKEIGKLEGILNSIEKYRLRVPEGSLKCQKKGEKYFFHHQIWNEKEQKWERKYIPKKNMAFIKALAQKHYYGNLEPVVRKNLSALKEFEKKYDPEKAERIFEDLSEARKGLVVPAFVSKEEKVRSWLAEKADENVPYPEHLKFETDQGEMVRSKSEVIIADVLYWHRDVILYKYEKPLELVAGGKIMVYHPDFTILNVRTGRVRYWEHAGMLGDERYAGDFVWRMNAFMRNGFLPGEDFVVTYETDEKPLDTAVVRKLVEWLCEG